MKAVVIYTSQTGFTKRYAEWLAEAADADCLELSDAKEKELSAYDAIIFGGWARAGGISGLDWFKGKLDRWASKRLAVFCVGASPVDSPDVAVALRRNFSDAERERVKAFYCPGGIDYERLPVPSRLLLRAFAAAMRSKRDKSEAERVMAEMLSSSYDISDRRYLEPILQYLES